MQQLHSENCYQVKYIVASSFANYLLCYLFILTHLRSYNIFNKILKSQSGKPTWAMKQMVSSLIVMTFLKLIISQKLEDLYTYESKSQTKWMTCSIQDFIFLQKADNLFKTAQRIPVCRGFESLPVFRLVHLLDNFDMVNSQGCLIFTFEKVLQIVLTFSKLLQNLRLREIFFDDCGLNWKQVLWQERPSEECKIFWSYEQYFFKLDFFALLCSDIVVDHQHIASSKLVLVPAEHDHGKKAAVAVGLDLLREKLFYFPLV